MLDAVLEFCLLPFCSGLLSDCNGRCTEVRLWCSISSRSIHIDHISYIYFKATYWNSSDTVRRQILSYIQGYIPGMLCSVLLLMSVSYCEPLVQFCIQLAMVCCSTFSFSWFRHGFCQIRKVCFVSGFTYRTKVRCMNALCSLKFPFFIIGCSQCDVWSLVSQILQCCCSSSTEEIRDWMYGYNDCPSQPGAVSHQASCWFSRTSQTCDHIWQTILSLSIHSDLLELLYQKVLHSCSFCRLFYLYELWMVELAGQQHWFKLSTVRSGFALLKWCDTVCILSTNSNHLCRLGNILQTSFVKIPQVRRHIPNTQAVDGFRVLMKPFLYLYQHDVYSTTSRQILSLFKWQFWVSTQRAFKPIISSCLLVITEAVDTVTFSILKCKVSFLISSKKIQH